MILHLYIKNTDAVPVGLQQQWLKALPLAKQRQLRARHNPADRLRSLLGLQLLDIAMQRANVTDYQAKNLLFHPGSKPTTNYPVDFSIAHSGALVACALTKKGQIGLDIEQRRPLPSEAIRGFLNAKELHLIQEHKADLFDIWTRKEATVKAHGTGLSDIPHVRLNGNTGQLHGKTWRLTMLQLYPGYSACVATSRVEKVTMPVEISLHKLIADTDIQPCVH